MAPILHLIAPAGSLQPFFAALGIDRGSQLIAIVQQNVGDAYRVTGNEAVLDATEDECRGGRTDDDARARDITAALSDSNVRAVIGVRGGAWLTRILPRIDFSVLDRRETSVAVFGFSELTPLVNIVGAHRQGRGFYDMGPAFLTYGLKRHATSTLGLSDATDPTPDEWMRANLRHFMREYFHRVVAMIEGRGGPITLPVRLIRGPIDDVHAAAFIGGNLTVFSTMIGSRYAECINPRGRWIVLEDFNDKPERFDRFLAHLTLADFWSRCDGVLLGDFHQGDRDLGPELRELLVFHLPAHAGVPILATSMVGHTWPMVPLPLHVSGRIERQSGDSLVISWPANCT